MRLACRLGQPNVDLMLRGMSWRQFREWQAYAELEPFDEARGDIRVALLACLLANIHRDSKKRSVPYELTDFLLSFGDDQKPAKPFRTQTDEQQQAIARMITAAFSEKKRLLDAYGRPVQP